MSVEWSLSPSFTLIVCTGWTLVTIWKNTVEIYSMFLIRVDAGRRDMTENRDTGVPRSRKRVGYIHDKIQTCKDS